MNWRSDNGPGKWCPENDRAWQLEQAELHRTSAGRVLVMGGRGHAKTMAMLAQMEAQKEQIAVEFGVPGDMLGKETQSPLTGNEFRTIIEQQPDWSTTEPPEVPPGGATFKDVKRYMK